MGQCLDGAGAVCVGIETRESPAPRESWKGRANILYEENIELEKRGGSRRQSREVPNASRLARKNPGQSDVKEAERKPRGSVVF